MNNQQVMNRVENLQVLLNKGHITIDAPCGTEPIIDLLGGIHARAAINETKGIFPNVAEELAKVEELIELMRK